MKKRRARARLRGYAPPVPRPDGEAKAALRIAAGREKAKRVRLTVTSFYDVLDEAAEKMVAREGDISCAKGCAACCNMTVQSSIEEALVIVQRYPDVVHDVLPELVRQEERLDEIVKEEKLVDFISPEGAAVLSRRWWQEARPCAFLRDGLCSIYEARPYACRNYFVKSDPALCGGPPGTKVTMCTPVDRARGLELLAARLPNGTINLGLLPTAMRHAVKISHTLYGTKPEPERPPP